MGENKSAVPLLEKGNAVHIAPVCTKETRNDNQTLHLENELLEKMSGHGIQPITFWEALIHMIKVNTGPGMFAMGNAFKHAGLLLAPILFLTLGTICVYGNHILINCSKELKRRKNLASHPTFADTMEWSFQEGPSGFNRWAPTMRKLVNTFNVITQLGFCSVFIVFIASTFQSVSRKYNFDLDIHLIVATTFVPMMATALVRSFKLLVPFAMVASFFMGVGLVLCVYISVHDLPPISSRPAIAELSRLPFFFGTSLFCFEGIAMILPLQSEMKVPNQLGGPFGVLNVGMAIIGCMTVGMGFIGYLKYGEEVEGSITLNLPPGLLTEIVQVAVPTSLLFSYSLQIHVTVAILWPDFERKYGPFKHPLWAEIGLRFGLSLITFVAAEVVPHLVLFMSLLGSVSSTALGLVFPPLCDFALNWGQSPGPNYFFNTFSLLLAIIGFSTGSYYSVIDIIKAFF